MLEKKEAELEHLKSGANARGQASPLRMMRHNGNASLKTEANQRPLDDTREVNELEIQVTSYSHGYVPSEIQLSFIFT